MMGGVTLAASLLAQSAMAAESPKPTQVEEIIVTGSRIRQTDTTTAAPVAFISPEAIEERGFIQPGQALNQVTSNVPSFPQAVGNGSAAGTGQQFPNLFGLGAGRTLTLVNGRRFVTSSQGLGDQVVDTNTIPTGLIQRIDVVEGGGAAVYGSDAIAGVVNYVLKKNFEGVELDAQYGVSSRDDYPQKSLRGTFGKNFADGRGNLAVDVEWSKTDPLLDSDRPRSNLARTTATNPADTSSTDGIPAISEVLDARFWEFNYNGVIFSPAPAPLSSFLYKSGGVTQQFSATGALQAYNPGTIRGIPFASGGDGFSYRDLAALYTGVERFSTNAIGHFDLTDHVKLSGEFMFANVIGTDPYSSLASNTVLNSAATGSGAIAFTRSNPYLTAEAKAVLGPGGPPLYLSKAWLDLLPTREGTNTTDTYRGVVGLDGDFKAYDRDFYWSASVSRGQTQGKFRNWGVYTAHFNNAIAAVKNSAGTIVCAINADASTANDDAACAPINPFVTTGGVSAAAQAYVTRQTGQDYLNTQDDFLATLGGDLFKLPGGEAKFSVAYEHRAEQAKFTPLAANQQGLVGSGAVTVATSGDYSTNEYSAELQVPILGGDFTLPFAQKLDLSGAYRQVDNSLAGQEGVWSAGLRWEVVDGVTFRGSRSRNFRAPTLDQLVAPSSTTLGAINQDPCDADRINSGPNPAVRLANCQALFAAHPGYGALASFQDPAENFSATLITSGGNPTLKNEVSDTTTYGVVLQPTFAPGLTIVVDRVEMDLTNALSAFAPQNFLATCFDTPGMPADVCSRFTRDATGAVVTAQSTTFNAGYVHYRGETYHVSYRLPMDALFGDRDVGSLELSVDSTHTALLETSVTGFDITRTDGTTAMPSWVTNFDAHYARGPLKLSYRLTYLPKAKVNLFDTIESTPTPNIDSNLRHDISVSYDLKGYVLRAGIINLTDEQPSYPTRSYGDILGRQYFVGLKARF